MSCRRVSEHPGVGPNGHGSTWTRITVSYDPYAMGSLPGYKTTHPGDTIPWYFDHMTFRSGSKWTRVHRDPGLNGPGHSCPRIVMPE